MKNTILAIISMLIVTVCLAKEINKLPQISRGSTPAALKSELTTTDKVDSTDKFGKTALMYACYDEDYEKVMLLVEAGADVNKQDNEGWSSLFYAVVKKNIQITEYLLDNGAQKDLSDIGGMTPYDYAVKKSSPALIGLLQ
jgi:ankyrin repeat protein